MIRSTTKKISYWLPRILSILFIVFISMFALDVLNEPQWLLALLIHLIPSCFLVAITIVAWKHEMPGGLLFLIAGSALLIFTRFQAVIIGIPAFIIGLLFLTAKRLPKS